MPILARLLGLFAALAYALQRAKLGFIRLRAAVIVICCLYAAHIAYRGWRTQYTPSHFVAIALSLLLTVALVWAGQRRYIVFREQPAPSTEAAELIRPEEKLFVRGSGIFAVSDMSRYLVEVPVVFWTTQLADHVVAAKVRAFNVLGVGVPSQERGWWYIFLEPKHVTDVTPGNLYFGLSSRPAVRVQCEGMQGRQLVYLSCASVEQRGRLLKELQARMQAAHHGVAAV